MIGTLLLMVAALEAQPVDQPQPYRAMRASSYRTDGGNADAVRVEPGASHTVMDVKGAGRVVHMWFTIATAEENYLRTTRLKIYWDGAAKAAVDVPFGDFHLLGHGKVRQVNTAFVTVRARPELNHNLRNPNVAGFNSYFPMPYGTGAKVVIENGSAKEPLTSLYYQVDYQAWAKAPSGLRFHAAYRETAAEAFRGHDAGRATSRNTKPEENHLILETAGAGHFVGVALSVDASGAGWWEGDEMIWVDGEATPSVYGTGTEDYFGGAWGFRGEYNMPYHGVTFMEKVPSRADWQAGLFTVYRFHEKDPVPFRKSFKMSIERGHNNHRRDSRYWSVAFWYQ